MWKVLKGPNRIHSPSSDRCITINIATSLAKLLFILTTTSPKGLTLYYRLLFLLFLTGCTAVAVQQFDSEYGLAQTQNRIVDISTADGEFYYHQIKPILENRCVVCHGCYDAPCQLKLSSPEGIDRGLT